MWLIDDNIWTNFYCLYGAEHLVSNFHNTHRKVNAKLNIKLQLVLEMKIQDINMNEYQIKCSIKQVENKLK